MKPWQRGVAIALIHVALVSMLGAKLLYDRATRPRAWALTMPFDPDLPIRGRYVSLRLIVDPASVDSTEQIEHAVKPVRLVVKDDRVMAIPDSAGESTTFIRWVEQGTQAYWVVDEPVAYFIPEDVDDPSIRPEGEQLWVEVTLPRKGPPRPIRLGVTRADGPIEPLELR